MSDSIPAVEVKNHKGKTVEPLSVNRSAASCSSAVSDFHDNDSQGRRACGISLAGINLRKSTSAQSKERFDREYCRGAAGYVGNHNAPVFYQKATAEHFASNVHECEQIIFHDSPDDLRRRSKDECSVRDGDCPDSGCPLDDDGYGDDSSSGEGELPNLHQLHAFSSGKKNHDPVSDSSEGDCRSEHCRSRKSKSSSSDVSTGACCCKDDDSDIDMNADSEKSVRPCCGEALEACSADEIAFGDVREARMYTDGDDDCSQDDCAELEDGDSCDVLAGVDPCFTGISVSAGQSAPRIHKSTILIIDGDDQSCRYIKKSLGNEHYKTYVAHDMRQGAIHAATRKPDLILINNELPGGCGVQLIKKIRGYSLVPIMVISAVDDEKTMVEALDSGADDYVIKPFGADEISARIRAHLRRRTIPSDIQSSDTVFTMGNVRVDLMRNITTKNGHEVHLTKLEKRLLRVLLSDHGKVLTQRFITQQVWGPHNLDQNKNLRIVICNLRAKLEDDPKNPVYILTETGVGYRLAV